MSKDFFVVAGGFSDQNWVNVRTPDIKGKCDGLTVFSIDSDLSHVDEVCQTHDIESPSTLVISPDQRFIYTSNETHDYKERGFGGGVTSFTLNKNNGQISFLNENFAFGSATAYVTIDRTGKFLLAANCGSKFYVSRYEEIDGELIPVVLRDEGVVTLFEILPDGKIGKCLDRLVLEGKGADPVEHASSHPHSVIIDDDDFIVIPDKGSDSICTARLDRKEGKIRKLKVNRHVFASSPRHAAFVPGTDFLLVQEEFGAHLNSFMINRETGDLTLISRLDTYDESVVSSQGAFCGVDMTRPWGIDVQVHPNGRWIYTDNTQPAIVQFEIDRSSGELKKLGAFNACLEKMPRGIQIDKEGKVLAVSGPLDDKLNFFAIDQNTGAVNLVKSVYAPTPTAIRFVYPEEK